MASHLNSVYQQPGGAAVVSNSQIASQVSNGINVNAGQAAADPDAVQITTKCDFGAAICMPGTNTRVDAKNILLETKGDAATGVCNRAGVFTMDGGSNALYASAYTMNSPGAVFNVR